MNENSINKSINKSLGSSPNYKIAFVVQRYGLEINGGAEFLCREVAEHLSKYCEIDVLTTCAIDYISWKNEYPPGSIIINDVNVFRFEVDRQRDNHKFNKLSKKTLEQAHSYKQEIKWMEHQGPYSSKLISFIESNKDNYDFFLFFTYLYATTYYCMPIVKDKAILLPAAHNEPAIYLQIFKKIFDIPIGFIYSTQEEKNLVDWKFHTEDTPSEIIGVGITVPSTIKSYKSEDDAIIYIGRIDESKGCGELFDLFIKYKMYHPSPLKLILVGKSVMDIPNHPDIIHLGFVDEDTKYDIIYKSKILIMPSRYESLSMVLLEAWYCKKPVLVSGFCEVLKGQCIRSNAGLWYENYEEFSACLNLLLFNKNLRQNLGKNGSVFVQNNYSWDIIEKKYLNLIDKLYSKKEPKRPL